MENIQSERACPVFLHGMWRCGSTWVWSCFRSAEQTYCYYEPLHHGLCRLTAGKLVNYEAEIFAAHSHPVLTQHHFAEFEPLLKPRRGVKHFQRPFAFRHFALKKDDKDEARMGWMKKAFDPFSIHIDRDPRDVWVSYMRQMKNGNYTFFVAWLRILEENAAHPVFAPLADRLRLRKACAEAAY